MNNLIILLKLICLLVFLGWMVIWIVLPMEVFTYQWLPKLSKNFNSTYIGGQGTNLFLLTFPVMLIAVLGCIYLHVKKKMDDSLESCSKPQQLAKHMSILGRPFLVLGPLGVITGMELIFLIMFIALVCWHFGNYYYVSVKHPYMMHMAKGIGVAIPQEMGFPIPFDIHRWQMSFRSVSLRLGYAGNIAWAFLFFPVTRISSILPLFGLTSESSIKYHIWIGQVVMILSALHSAGFIIYWAMTNQMALLIEWSKTYVTNLGGTISWAILIAMWVTSFAYTRRRSFEIFFYTHQLYPLAIFFYIVHIGVAWLCQILPGLFLFTMDRYLRFLQSRSQIRVLSARILPGGTVEITFAKSPHVHYNPTSNLFLNVPKISKLQWHPFTVISNDNLEPDRLSIAFNSGGSWTRKMYQELSSIDRLQVSIEGPYGPHSTSFLKHKSLVLISGGSGITPFISIIREVIHRSNTHNGQAPSILLVCAFRHGSHLSMLDLLLPIGATSVDDLLKVQLQIQAHITRENGPPPTDDQKLVQTKWFKPNPLDSPITPVLGPNGWLCLSLIISSSFILFLILLALVTQYHIYPIDHNTSTIYNFTVWCIWELFFMCLSIIVISTIIFLLQKRKVMATEEKQIQNVEVPTPMASPGCWFFEEGREIESIPHQSLVQATQVHYGGRPNLQKILRECEGEDIGVIASGPRGMRHDVARICASSRAKNLHYEYLSFNW